MDEDLKNRIAALLRKARSDGSSEAEAIAAAERAARLMAEAGVSDTDVEFDEEQAELKTRTPTIRDTLWVTVGMCTNCAVAAKRDWTPVVIFIGREPGPQIAAYLVDVLNRAIDRAVAKFKATPEYKRRRTIGTRRAAVQDFVNGMVTRLRNRLREIFANSSDERAIKDAWNVLDQRFPGCVAAKLKARSIRFGSAASAGFAAGGHVQIAAGVSSRKAPAQIGRS